MRLLFDQNLSYQLVALLQDLYPESDHVRLAGMADQEDIFIWEFARTNGFVIVTKDTDYLAIGARLGHPPKPESTEGIPRRWLDEE